LGILDFLKLQPVLNNLYFVIRHSEAKRRKYIYIFQIFYWLRIKFIFFCFSLKTSLVEMLEYFFNMLMVFGHIVWVDKYIIQIDYDTDIQKIKEDVIHESLKSYRSISKTKEYYRPLKWFIMYLKSSFLFITASNTNQVVSMVKIYLWINPSFVM